MSGTRALLELTRVRALLLLRQPEILFWIFLFPVVLTLVLGLAFRGGTGSASRVAVVADAAGGVPASLAALRDAPELEVLVTGAAEARRLARTGAVDLLARDERGVRIAFDPSRAEAGTARLRVLDVLERAAGRTDPLPVEEEELTARGARYVDWFVPGMLGFGVMSTSVWGIGLALVDARQKRLLRRLLVTPMRRTHYLLAPILSRMAVLFGEVLVLLVFARWVLGVPFAGSPVTFALLCAVGGLSFSGLAVLLGSRVRTHEAVNGLINLATIPMSVACGVFFSYERFSAALHPWIRLLPLTAFNDAARAVMLEGAGLASVAGRLAVLAAWGLGAFLLGLFLFRWD